jgi:hypothetical protein
MKITNKYNLPDPIVRALSHDDYTKGESNRSVTQLIDSPRVRILKKEHEDEITYDVSELIWIALGKGIHRMFEDHGVGQWKPEQRLFAQVHGWTISGQVDIQFMGERNGKQVSSLYDYKITGVYSYMHWKASYDQQLNLYDWLAAENGLIIDELFIVFVFRDWKWRDADKQAGYPPAPIMVVPVKRWSHAQQRDYMYKRVELHQGAEFSRLTGEELPLCTDEDRWQKPAKFAVRKPGNKTAKRVLDSEKDAESYMRDNGLREKGFIIEPRPAAPTRCADGWCPLTQWCTQWQAELAAGFTTNDQTEENVND